MVTKRTHHCCRAKTPVTAPALVVAGAVASAITALWVVLALSAAFAKLATLPLCLAEGGGAFIASAVCAFKRAIHGAIYTAVFHIMICR